MTGTPDFPGHAPGREPLVLSCILGNAGEGVWQDQLHEMEHRGQVEYLSIPETEAARRRMRIFTDRGRDCAIALPREQQLEDGAVLHIAPGLAIIARVYGGRRLRLVPHSISDALRIGHWCGNLHWKVVFGDGWMEVVLDGPEERYRDRLRDLAPLAGVDIGAPE